MTQQKPYRNGSSIRERVLCFTPPYERRDTLVSVLGRKHCSQSSGTPCHYVSEQCHPALFFWHYQTSQAGRIRTGLFGYVLAFGLLIVGTLVGRRIFTGSAVAVGMIAVLSGASVGLGRWSQRTAPPAVVTAMDVVVNRGPGTGYQRQFEQPLQPGVECAIRERRGGWWEIELPDGKSGWIDASAAEPVTPTSVNDSIPR